jgi:hypothetical protein
MGNDFSASAFACDDAVAGAWQNDCVIARDARSARARASISARKRARKNF